MKITLPCKQELDEISVTDPAHLYYLPIVGRLYVRRVEMCLDLCRGGERVLEVGFGSGITFPSLNLIYKEIHGVDLDSSIDKISLYYRHKGLNVSLKNGNVLFLPYPDESFDTILLVSILEHLKAGELEKCFNELLRVLKPNGQVVFGTPIDRPLMTFFFRVLGYDIKKYHYSNHNDIIKMAEDKMTRTEHSYMTSMMGRIYLTASYAKKHARLLNK